MDIKDLPGIRQDQVKALYKKKIKTVDKLKEHPEIIKTLNATTRMELKYRIAHSVPYKDFAHLKYKDIYIVGSVRRRKPRVKDLDFLTTLGMEEAIERLSHSRQPENKRIDIIEIYAKGDRRVSFVAKVARHTMKCDLFRTTKNDLPYALLHFTGSWQYNVKLRALAQKRNMKLNQYGLWDNRTGKRINAGNTEKDIVLFLGATWRQPYDREGG